MERTYSFVSKSGEVFGPVPTTVLKQWADQGRLLPDSTLIESSTGKSLKARELPELFEAPSDLQPAPTPVVGSNQDFPFDTIAGLVAIGFAILFFGFSIDTLSGDPYNGVTDTGYILELIVFTALFAFCGVGIIRKLMWGFAVAIAVFAVAAVRIWPGLGPSSGFLSGVVAVLPVLLLVYVCVRLFGGIGHRPNAAIW